MPFIIPVTSLLTPWPLSAIKVLSDFSMLKYLHSFSENNNNRQCMNSLFSLNAYCSVSDPYCFSSPVSALQWNPLYLQWRAKYVGARQSTISLQSITAYFCACLSVVISRIHWNRWQNSHLEVSVQSCARSWAPAKRKLICFTMHLLKLHPAYTDYLFTGSISHPAASTHNLRPCVRTILKHRSTGLLIRRLCKRLSCWQVNHLCPTVSQSLLLVCGQHQLPLKAFLM